MAVVTRWCARCGHTEAAHGAEGCDVEVRDYGEMDCFCDSFVAVKQRFTENGAECRHTHVKGYTGAICSCPPLTCFAARGAADSQAKATE